MSCRSTVFSVPEHVAAIESHVTETAIDLSWAAIARTSAGEPLATRCATTFIAAELDRAAAEIVGRDVSQLSLNGKLQLLASQEERSYSDKAFEFGKTYATLFAA